MTHEDFLLHYGVKGMKWGIRRKRTALVGSVDPGDRRRESLRTKSARIGTFLAAPSVVGAPVGAVVGSKMMKGRIKKAITNKTGYKMKELSRKSRKQLISDVSKYKTVKVKGKDGKIVSITEADIRSAVERARIRKEKERRDRVAGRR